MVRFCQNFHQRQYSSKQKHCLKIFFEEFEFLWKRDGLKVCTFGPTLTPHFLLKKAEIKEYWQQCGKISAIGLPKYVKMGAWSHVQGSESKFYTAYFIHTTPGQLPVKRFWFKHFPVLRL